jgi:hypothetical protein
MKGPIVFGKRRQSQAESLRSFRTFGVIAAKPKEPERPPPEDIPTTVDPNKEEADKEQEDEDDDDEEDTTLPGDQLRMQYEMQGGGWIPVAKKDQQAPPETQDVGSSLSMLINRDVVQKIADQLNIKIPSKLALDVLKRHVDVDKPSIRIMQKAAKELMPIVDRETRTTVPPAYRHRLVQMFARAMYVYFTGKGTQLMGSGTRLRRKMDPNAYHPHAQAFVRGLTLAIKPALSLGATAMSYSPSIAAKLLAPAVQAAISSL